MTTLFHKEKFRFKLTVYFCPQFRLSIPFNEKQFDGERETPKIMRRANYVPRTCLAMPQLIYLRAMAGETTRAIDARKSRVPQLFVYLSFVLGVTCAPSMSPTCDDNSKV